MSKQELVIQVTKIVEEHREQDRLIFELVEFICDMQRKNEAELKRVKTDLRKLSDALAQDILAMISDPITKSPGKEQ